MKYKIILTSISLLISLSFTILLIYDIVIGETITENKFHACLFSSILIIIPLLIIYLISLFKKSFLHILLWFFAFINLILFISFDTDKYSKKLMTNYQQ